MRWSLKKWVIAAVIVSIVIVIVIAIGGYFFYTGPQCGSEECFNDNLIECKRSSFIADKPDTVLGYQILSVIEGKCRVEVELIQVKRGSGDLVGLEGEKMICELQKGVFTQPESDIKDCHGSLKEGIQEAIIQRMHSQLIENIGQIKLETDIF